MYTCLCGYACLCMCVLSEARRGHWMSCSIILCCVPFRLGLSLDLEPYWWPASPSNPPVSTFSSTRLDIVFENWTSGYLNPGPGLLQQVVLPIMLSFQHLVHTLQVKRPSKYSCFTPRKQYSGTNKKMRPGSDCNDGGGRWTLQTWGWRENWSEEGKLH